MNVSDMISAMNILGIGEVYNDDDSTRIALVFLNLAHDELYRETANLNSDVLVKDIITTTANQSILPLGRPTFSVSKVLQVGSKRKIKGKSVLEFADYESENIESADPLIYTKIKQTVNIHPIIPTSIYTFNIWSVPERTPLFINTLESAIPYPLSYQSVLVNGALYYLFQDESGFKNQTRENEALRRWINGKSDLISYLYGSNNQSINTFENA